MIKQKQMWVKSNKACYTYPTSIHTTPHTLYNINSHAATRFTHTDFNPCIHFDSPIIDPNESRNQTHPYSHDSCTQNNETNLIQFKRHTCETTTSIAIPDLTHEPPRDPNKHNETQRLHKITHDWAFIFS